MSDMLNNPQMQNYHPILQRPLYNTNGDTPSTFYILRKEPVIIRGDGNITVFGLNNHFPLDMPCKLISLVAPDEYKYTIYIVNRILQKRLSYNIKLLFCACLCFCCTLGMSTCPSLAFNRITKNEVMSLLNKENKRIYNYLGLHWSLEKQHFGPIPIIEYVLQIDFINKPRLSTPD
ncbi:hypothetical protein NQ317_006093 [Molorchus minor]|uniref:Golgin subfamily A member 7/ERF4 domain-containing protein n=1 Tax=Molorchus minor TaxID=1323400 RepID=A0ABQ9JZI1_9CUCU|nr:hypothetical protein NQ317_006093 [Molorchus minor]